jgi:hypothetical protein
MYFKPDTFIQALISSVSALIGPDMYEINVFVEGEG